MTDASHNALTGAEAMVQLLAAHGVKHIFGLPFDVQNAEVDAGDVWAQPEFGHFPAWPGAPDP
jgi:hypothetical protein